MVRREPVSLDAADLSEPVPQVSKQRRATAMKLGQRRGQRLSLARPRHPSQRGEPIHRGGGADNALVILGPGLEVLGCFVWRWIEFGNVQRLQEVALPPEHPDVRPVELVCTA